MILTQLKADPVGLQQCPDICWLNLIWPRVLLCRGAGFELVRVGPDFKPVLVQLVVESSRVWYCPPGRSGLGWAVGEQ